MVTSAGLAFIFRHFKKFKLVTTVHNEFEKSAILMGLGDRVIAVSEAVAKTMEKRGVKRSKLRVILNGTIGSPELSSESPPAQILNHPAITFVGGLHPRKGHRRPDQRLQNGLCDRTNGFFVPGRKWSLPRSLQSNWESKFDPI
jgi:hypothetical protein